jgi:hypothetical protein
VTLLGNQLKTHQFDSGPFSLSEMGRSGKPESSGFRTPDLTRNDDPVADFQGGPDRRNAGG